MKLQKTLLLVLSLTFSLLFARDVSAADSLVTIHSFYLNRGHYLKPIVASSVNGDTAIMVVPYRVSRDTSAIDTVLLRIRTWNSLTRATLTTSTVFSSQAKGLSNLFAVANIDRVPRLLYPETPGVLVVANLYDGSVVQRIKLDTSIINLSISPDGSLSFVRTKSNTAYLIRNRDLSKVFSKKFSSYEIPLCKTDSWTPDNTLFMLRILTVMPPFFGEAYQAVDLATGKYFSGSYERSIYGPFCAAGRCFITNRNTDVYVTFLDSAKKTIHTNRVIQDYAWVGGTSRMVMVDLDSTISIWDANADSIVFAFKPTGIKGFNFSVDGHTFSYINKSNELEVIDLVHIRGLYTIPLDFQADVAIGDQSTMVWLPGDRAMKFNCLDGKLRLMDLPLRRVTATFDSTLAWFISQDGTALFLITNMISRIDMYDGRILSQFPDQEILRPVNNISLRPDASEVLSCDSLGLNIWNTETGQNRVRRNYENLINAWWTGDSSTIVVQRYDSLALRSSVLMLASQTLDSLWQSSSTDSVVFDSFSPDKKRFICRSNSALCVYDASTAKLIRQYKSKRPLICGTLSQDGYLVAMADDSGKVELRSALTDSIICNLDARYYPRFIHIAPSNEYLLVNTKRGLTLYSIPDGRVIQELSTEVDNAGFIFHDSLSIGIFEEAILEFENANGHPTKIDTYNRAYFSPDGEYYAYAGRLVRDSLKINDYRHRKPYRSVPDLISYSPIQWSNDAHKLAFVDVYNNIIIYTPSFAAVINDVDSPDERNTTIEALSEVRVGPNPSTGSLNISSEIPILSISIVDLNARLIPISPTIIDAQHYQLQFPTSGVYILRVVHEHSVSKRVVVVY